MNKKLVHILCLINYLNSYYLIYQFSNFLNDAYPLFNQLLEQLLFNLPIL